MDLKNIDLKNINFDELISKIKTITLRKSSNPKIPCGFEEIN